jgi:putative FmdB family regulatory protein
MPTYDYLCPNGHRFEVLHSVSADGPTICPICGATPVRKAFSAPTIHFKGSGWAKKDRSSGLRSGSQTA